MSVFPSAGSSLASRSPLAALALTLIPAVLMLTSTVAYCDNPAQVLRAGAPNGAAAADALFRAGRAAALQGDHLEAAARFAESYRLDPAPGTLLNLAVAEDKLGRLAAAWEHARAAALALPPGDERTLLARQLFDAIDARLPRLTLRSGANLEANAHVSVDGVELLPASFGIPLPLDPGPHTVMVRSPEHRPFAVTIRLDEGVRAEQVLEPGEALPPPSTAGDAHPSSPLRLIGYGLLAGGALSLAAGGVIGGLALDRGATVERHCTDRCDPEGFDASKSGKTLSTVSTVSFIAAGALLAGGVLLVLVAPAQGTRQLRAPTDVAFRF